MRQWNWHDCRRPLYAGSSHGEDARSTFLLSGTGDLIEPDDGVVAWSRVPMRAPRLVRSSDGQLDARDIAREAMTIAAKSASIPTRM